MRATNSTFVVLIGVVPSSHANVKHLAANAALRVATLIGIHEFSNTPATHENLKNHKRKIATENANQTRCQNKRNKTVICPPGGGASNVKRCGGIFPGADSCMSTGTGKMV